MNTKRTVLIGIAFIAILAAGCSNNKAVTGPENSVDEATFISDVTPTPNAAKNASDMPRQWIELVGKLIHSDIEGGCWYIETKKGERYEPRFDHIDATAESGVTLSVSGYIDETINSTCMIGPVIQVISYKVIYPVADKTTPSVEGPVTLTGTFGLTKDGCYFISIPKEDVALQLPICPAPPLLGSTIVVVGTWSALDYMPCGMDHLLNVETITFVAPPPTPVYW